jgi:hypothetical protein
MLRMQGQGCMEGLRGSGCAVQHSTPLKYNTVLKDSAKCKRHNERLDEMNGELSGDAETLQTELISLKE